MRSQVRCSSRSFIPRLLLAVAMAALIVLAVPALTQARIARLAVPSQVPQGTSAHIDLKITGSRACRLSFKGPKQARRPRSRRFAVRQPYVRIAWRTPRNAARGGWKAAVKCARGKSRKRRAATSRADFLRLKLRVVGKVPGHAALVTPGSLTVRTSTKPFTTNKPGPPQPGKLSPPGSGANGGNASGAPPVDNSPGSPAETPNTAGQPSAAVEAWSEGFGGGPGSAPDSSTLDSGEVLAAGQERKAPNGQYSLVMQSDGNLVLYTQQRALWNSQTNGHPGAYAAMQSDGNLVVYSASDAPLWSSGTAGHPGAQLLVQDDSNVVLYTGNTAIWATNTSNPILAPGEKLHAGDKVYSPSRQYQLVMQDDGNLVLYNAFGRAIFDAHTAGHPGAYAYMQNDGNFVVYSSSDAPLWYSGTGGHTDGHFYVQDDANLVLYTPGNQAYWATNTHNYSLTKDEKLFPGQYLESTNGLYWFAMQGDGNLVLYAPHGAVWASNTAGHPGAWAVMQADGNLVVYSASNTALWASGTAGHPDGHLWIQTDCNAVLYTPSNQPYWATNTGGCNSFLPPIGDDYPYRGGPIDRVDQWGFFTRECTSFVAWRMNRDGAAFYNGMRGGTWGHARNWDDNARRLGYPVNGTPTVGSIAQWDANEGGGIAGDWGHVGYVARVNGDNSVLMEDYNGWSDHNYRVRTVRAPRYIHVIR